MIENIELSIIPLKKRLVTLPFKVIGMIVGGAMTVMGILLSLTIIGAIIGIPMAMVGAAIGMIARGYTKASCPHCNYAKNYVHNDALNFKCKKCETLTTVDWIK
jgi:hypothetical protein